MLPAASEKMQKQALELMSKSETDLNIDFALHAKKASFIVNGKLRVDAKAVKGMVGEIEIYMTEPQQILAALEGVKQIPVAAVKTFYPMLAELATKKSGDNNLETLSWTLKLGREGTLHINGKGLDEILSGATPTSPAGKT